jgi:integrase
MDMSTDMLRDRTIPKLKTKTGNKNSNFPDGKGLYLEVRRDGESRNWSFRYALDGEKLSIPVGSYPAVSLHEARKKREHYRTLVGAGIDPRTELKAEKVRQARARAKGKPFRDFGEAFIANQEKKKAWTPKVAKINISFIRNVIYPTKPSVKYPNVLGLGDVPIPMLDFGHPDGGNAAVKMIAEALQRWHWDNQPPTGERLRQLIYAILTFARDAFDGVLMSPDAALLTRHGKGPLSTFLNPIEKFHRPVSRPMLPFKELPGFMIKLRSTDVGDGRNRNRAQVNWAQRNRIGELRAKGWTMPAIADEIDRSYAVVNRHIKAIERDATPRECPRRRASEMMEFMILTATRPEEPTMAKWDDINDKGLWTIPVHKTLDDLGGKPLLVPLSTQALAVVERMRQRADEDGFKSPYIFTSDLDIGRCRRGEAQSSQVLNHYLNHVMGYPNKEIVPAGFRRTFRTWGGETGSGSKDREIDLEMCLGHLVGNKVRNIYAEYVERIEPRRQILQAYADFADGLRPSAQIFPFERQQGEAS